MTKLRLFGSIHFNTRSIVVDDLREFAAGADAIAVEQPRLGDTPRAAVAAILRFPFVFVGVQLMFAFLQVPFFALFNRDLLSTEQLAARAVAEERPVHAVDRHPISVLRERHVGWVVANWVAFVALASLFPVVVAGATGLAVGLLSVAVLRGFVAYRRTLLLAALGISALCWEVLVRRPLVTEPMGVVVPLLLVVTALAVVNVTLERRNEVMLEEVAALAAEHGYDRLCLATGKSHVSGMVDIAPSFDLRVVDVFECAWRSSGDLRAPGAVTDAEIADSVGESGDSVGGSDDSDVPDGIEAAGNVLPRRAVATVVDWVLILVVTVVVSMAVVLVDEASSMGNDALFGSVLLLWWFLGPPAYFAISEATAGRTVGKSLLGLTVVRLDGTPCTARDAVVRTLLHPIDYLPFCYLLGAVVAAQNRYGQRIGDRAAGTVVVERDALAALETGTDDRAWTDAESGDPWSPSRPQPSRRADGTARSAGDRPTAASSPDAGLEFGAENDGTEPVGSEEPTTTDVTRPGVPTQTDDTPDDDVLDVGYSFDTDSTGDGGSDDHDDERSRGDDGTDGHGDSIS